MMNGEDRGGQSCFGYGAASLLSAFIVLTTPAAAQEFEAPPSVEASSILADKATGSNYTVGSPVASDGFLRIYNVETDYGSFRFDGDAFLRIRLRELAAINTLAQMEGTDRFQESFKESLKAPVDYAGDLVTKPGETVERTVTGVGRLFGRVASGVKNIGKGEDNAAEALLGVAKARREIAVEMGVDPYSDFQPLDERLDRAARAAAFGGLTVKGLFALVPGGAGLAVSSASTATDVADMVKQRTSTELRDINRQRLTQAVGNKQSVGLFLDNPNYTPTDQTIVATALVKFTKARNVDAFLVRAAGISERSLAIFMRERAWMLARYHDDVEPIESFTTIADVPMAISASGALVGVFPLDSLAWTGRSAPVMARINDEAPEGGVKLVISGTVTETARGELEKLGWSIEENAFPIVE